MTIQKSISPSEIVEGSPSGPDNRTGEAEIFGLLDLLRIVKVWRILILGTMLVVFVASAIAALVIDPSYHAVAAVMLDQQKNTVEDVTAVLSDLPTTDASVATVTQNQEQILQSAQLANRVIKKLRLDEDPEFNPPQEWYDIVLAYINPLNWLPQPNSASGAGRTRDIILTRFEKRLEVDPLDLSTATQITFKANDPVKAARIANAIADDYIQDQLNAKFEATQKTVQWLGERIGELSQQIQLADAAVQQYKTEHHIDTTTINTTPAGSTIVSVLDQQVASINSQLVLAKADLAEKQAAYGRLAELAQAGQASDSGQAVTSTVIIALRAQESVLNGQLADLSSKYGPRHPRMQDLLAQKAVLDGKIAQEVQRVVEVARNDLHIAQVRVASLEESLRDLEARTSSQNTANIQLVALQASADSKRLIYQSWLARLSQTQNQSGILTPDARVISRAEVPKHQSLLRPLLVPASIPAGFILGLLLAFMAEQLNPGFRTLVSLECLVGIPVFAVIPELKCNKKVGENPAEAFLAKPMSAFSEAVRSLRLRVEMSNMDNPPKVIMVGSSISTEGKTTLAICLARSFACSGHKTILVDGDLRRPGIAEAIGIASAKRGIVEVLRGQYSVEQCVVKDPKSDLLVLPCAERPSTPTDLLASQAMANLMSNLRNAFDIIIMDTAPILPVSDAKIISQMVDFVLFVVRWEKTPREAVVNAVRALRDSHAQVSGCVLSRADKVRSHYYIDGYQSYDSYAHYYDD